MLWFSQPFSLFGGGNDVRFIFIIIYLYVEFEILPLAEAGVLVALDKFTEDVAS